MSRGTWLLLALAVAACGDDAEECTTEFRVATVFVEDQAGAPVTDAGVQTYLGRTGELVPVTTLIDLLPGHYPILDDNATSLIHSSAEPFRVTAVRGAGTPVEAPYTFRTPNGCHIEKVSGPDTLVVP